MEKVKDEAKFKAIIECLAQVGIKSQDAQNYAQVLQEHEVDESILVGIHKYFW